MKVLVERHYKVTIQSECELEELTKESLKDIVKNYAAETNRKEIDNEYVGPTIIYNEAKDLVLYEG